MTSSGVWSSIRHLRRNAGTFAMLRLLFVSGLLFGLAVFVGIREHQPAPLLGFVGGGAIPMLSRERLIERLAASIRGARILGVLLLVGVAVTGVMRDRLGDALESPVVLAALMFFAALYLSMYFVLYGDHRVEWRR